MAAAEDVRFQTVLVHRLALGFLGKPPREATPTAHGLRFDLLHSCHLRKVCQKGLGLSCHFIGPLAVQFQVGQATLEGGVLFLSASLALSFLSFSFLGSHSCSFSEFL